MRFIVNFVQCQRFGVGINRVEMNNEFFGFFFRTHACRRAKYGDAFQIRCKSILLSIDKKMNNLMNSVDSIPFSSKFLIFKHFLIKEMNL